MIFSGDIALPFEAATDISNFPETICNSSWIVNLEGSLIKTNEPYLLSQRKVFNCYNSLRVLSTQLNIVCCNLANNHLLDAANVNVTIENLNELELQHVGAGRTLTDAQREIVIGKYVLVSFGWEGISCIPASSDDVHGGVNPYEKNNVLGAASFLLEKYKDKKIIFFMHWNYELELYPQPLDRELSHKLIDLGLYAVIGCHAHRVQPIEIYKGHPIVYGLGNFAFRQNTYMNGALKFPEFSYDEIAFEIDDEDKFYVHRLRYNPEDHVVAYLGKEELSQTSFDGMTDNEYIKFFKKNRIQKKLLPVFYFNDSNLTYRCKLLFLKFRQKGINILVKNKRLFNSVKSLASKIS